jgi:hypothetical protein
MSKYTRPSLIVLNAVLLAGLAWAVLGSRVGAGAGLAVAQAPAGPAAPAAGRLRGEYLMLSGRVQGSNTDITYVIDTANQEMIALSWDRSRRILSPMGWRSLSEDLQVAGAPEQGQRSRGTNR